MEYPTSCSDIFIDYDPVYSGKIGLEIGGPSSYFFRSAIYTTPARLDNLNFAEKTLWNQMTHNTPYLFEGKTCPGTVYIADVVNMKGVISDATYDFVFASHILEHLVNPLLALEEMTRVLKKEGYCILVLPWKEATFDHKRPITPFGELVSHYYQKRDERDVSDHIEYIIKDYDFSKDPGVLSVEHFRERCKHQYENRALHVHVFDFKLIDECFAFFGYNVLHRQLVPDCNQIVIAQRCS